MLILVFWVELFRSFLHIFSGVLLALPWDTGGEVCVDLWSSVWAAVVDWYVDCIELEKRILSESDSLSLSLSLSPPDH